MSDTLLPPNTDPAHTPPSTDSRPRRIVCDCCGCTLALDGGVLKTGDRAKEMQRADDKLETLRADLARVQRELDEAKRELGEARARLAPASDDDDDL